MLPSLLHSEPEASPASLFHFISKVFPLVNFLHIKSHLVSVSWKIWTNAMIKFTFFSSSTIGQVMCYLVF